MGMKEGLNGTSYVCPKCGESMELRESTEDFLQSFEDMHSRSQWCIVMGGDYFEGQECVQELGEAQEGSYKLDLTRFSSYKFRSSSGKETCRYSALSVRNELKSALSLRVTLDHVTPPKTVLT
ncbi:hypothetical protein TNCV_2550111 [Trichonephila clavipes]|nr:hypothetical protein TNCV_2550111 [Trichonephila clavipes]